MIDPYPTLHHAELTPRRVVIVVCALREYADSKQPGLPSVREALDLANELEGMIA